MTDNDANHLSRFICSALFRFPGHAEMSCQWADDLTVRLLMEGSSTLNVKSQIELLTGAMSTLI